MTHHPHPASERIPAGHVVILLVFSLLLVFGRTAEAGQDTTRTAVVGKSPRWAVLRSALIPGLGQWYNGQKLKALIVFGGEAALAGNVIYYDFKARESTTEAERLFYRDYKSRFLWILVGVHILNMIDAYVDAHLWRFDTGPNLVIDSTGDKSGTVAFVSLSWSF